MELYEKLEKVYRAREKATGRIVVVRKQSWRLFELSYKLLDLKQGVNKEGKTILYLVFEYMDTDLKKFIRSFRQKEGNIPLKTVKVLLEHEKHKIRTGELQVTLSSFSESTSTDHEVGGNQAMGSGRARRDAAARAMQGLHSRRLLGNGEERTSMHPLQKQGLERKKASSMDHAVKDARTKLIGPLMDVMVVDLYDPADWVKINVQRTKDCFEVCALAPGLLHEEVHIQLDPAGRLVTAGSQSRLIILGVSSPLKRLSSCFQELIRTRLHLFSPCREMKKVTPRIARWGLFPN